MSQYPQSPHEILTPGKKAFADYSFDFKDENAEESEEEDILKVPCSTQ